MAGTFTIMGKQVPKTYVYVAVAVAAGGAFLMYTKQGQKIYVDVAGPHPASRVLAPTGDM